MFVLSVSISDIYFSNNLKRLYRPYKYSGKEYQFVEGEEKILQKMRAWCKEYFRTHRDAEEILSAIDPNSNEKNLIWKVMKIYDDEEDSYGIRIKDTTGAIWKWEVDKIKYPELHINDIIRIKSAKSSPDSTKLELRPHSNILRLLKDSLIVKELKTKIQDSDLDRVINDKEEPLKPLVVTEFKEHYKHLKKTTLMDIIYPNEHKKEDKENNDDNWEDTKLDDDEFSKELAKQHMGLECSVYLEGNNCSLLEFMVIGYEPRNIKDFVQAHCNKCSKSFTLEGCQSMQEAKCTTPGCGNRCKLFYTIKFLVKDEEWFDTNFCYPILLYSHDGNKCSNFFRGIEPTNLYKDSKTLEKLINYMDILLKFNIICRTPVINRDGHLMIVDAQMQNLL